MEPGGGMRVGGVEDVERQFAELWRTASTAEAAVVRACMMNLVVCCESGSELPEVTTQLARLSQQAPGRALVIVPETEAPSDGMEVYVSSHCHPVPGGKQVCTEQVNLEASGEGWKLVPGTVRQLLVGDCPVYTWWRRRRIVGEPLFEPIAGLADRVIVDSDQAAEPSSFLEALERIVEDVPGSGAVGDLAWARLEPWRELVASFFDPPAARPTLDRLDLLEVTGSGPACGNGVPVATAYLAGWVAARLGWTWSGKTGIWRRPAGGEARIACRDDGSSGGGGITAVRLAAGTGAQRATFEASSVERATDLVRLAVTLPGESRPPHLHKLTTFDPLSLLHGYLQQQMRDSVFVPAIAFAARIGGTSS